MIVGKRFILVLAVLAAVAASVVLSGCASSGAAAAAGASGASAPASAATVAPPTIKVLAPLEGAELAAGEVRIQVETTGLTFVMPSNTLVPGEGHVHFTIDDKPFQMSTTPEYTLKGVGPGSHTVKAELVQNSTAPFDPPVVQTVAFTVK